MCVFHWQVQSNFFWFGTETSQSRKDSQAPSFLTGEARQKKVTLNSFKMQHLFINKFLNTSPNSRIQILRHFIYIPSLNYDFLKQYREEGTLDI
jgi:hypothetical protein